MPDHYDIELRLDGENAIASPVPDLTIGNTVRYFSNDGEASVKFPEASPFEAQEVSDGETVIVVKAGTFRCQCFIKKDGHLFGWKNDPSPSGADHKVKQP